MIRSSRLFAALAVLSLVLSGLGRAYVSADTAPTYNGLSGMQVLSMIRRQFRSHRPPPPYVTYSIERYQLTNYGYPDYPENYTDRVWCRSIDRACLKRRIFRDDDRGNLEFLRAAFNEPWDPGPPTADLFEPAPVKPHTMDFVPTPEPPHEKIIATVRAYKELDYNVTRMVVEDGVLHVSLQPLRDPDRNRLRELFVDPHTYELHKVVATDKLFVNGDRVYGVLFTISLGMLRGIPVIQDIHGIVNDGYDGDGQQIDYHFRDVHFPTSLPAWYFDPHTYAQHKDEAPE